MVNSSHVTKQTEEKDRGRANMKDTFFHVCFMLMSKQLLCCGALAGNMPLLVP